MSLAAAFHDWYSLDRYRARLAIGITLSLLAHALLLSLQFGLPGIGLPSLELPWNQRRAQADLSIVLAPPPAVTPESAPLPEAASPAPKPIRPGFVLTPPAPKPAPKAHPRRHKTPARQAAKPARKKAAPAPPAEVPPVLEPLPEAAAPEPRVPTPVITQTTPNEETFTVAQPDPQELGQAAVRQEQVPKAEREAQQRETQQREAQQREAEQHLRAEEEAARREAEQQAQAREAAEREARRSEEAVREAQALEEQRKTEEAARQRALALEQQRKQEQQERQKQEAARQAEALALQKQREEEERRRLAALKEEQEREEQERQRALQLEAEARRRAEEAARVQQAEAQAARQRAREQAEAETRQRMAAESRPSESAPGTALPRTPGGSLAARALNQARQLDPSMLAPVRPAAPANSNDARRYSLFGRAERDVNLRMYVESWKMKIERNGNLNYAQSSKDHARGDPVVTVAIRSDGSVEDVVIHRSSGRPELDEAVRRIVRVNARYGAFPPEIARRFDVIEIRHIWNFDETLRLLEEMR